MVVDSKCTMHFPAAKPDGCSSRNILRSARSLFKITSHGSTETMMSRFTRLVFAIALTTSLWQVTGSTVMAQSNYSKIDKPFDRPTFSPYLNLFRSGNGPVMNYFGAVRPQQQFYAQSGELNEELDNVKSRQDRQQGMNSNGRRMPGVYKMGVTGHSVGFNTVRSSGAGGGEGGGSGPQLSGFNSPQSGGSSQFGGSQFGNNQSGGQQFGGNSGQSSNYGFGSGGF